MSHTEGRLKVDGRWIADNSNRTIGEIRTTRPDEEDTANARDIREGTLLIDQNKGRKKLRMNITGQLEELLRRISERKRQFSVRSLALICNERGAKLGRDAMRYRFDAARLKAINSNPKLANAIAEYQVRDLRAKAGTDKADTGDLVQAQKQLGHSSVTMTEHYVRARAGEKVEPTK